MVYAVELSNKTQGKRKVRRKKLWFLIPPLNVLPHSIKTLIPSFPSQPSDMCPGAMHLRTSTFHPFQTLPSAPMPAAIPATEPQTSITEPQRFLSGSDHPPGSSGPRVRRSGSPGGALCSPGGCSVQSRGVLGPSDPQFRTGSARRPECSPRRAVPGSPGPAETPPCPRTPECGPSSPRRSAAAGGPGGAPARRGVPELAGKVTQPQLGPLAPLLRGHATPLSGGTASCPAP